MNRTTSPSSLLPSHHHISPTSSSTAFSVATMRNTDLTNKPKKVWAHLKHTPHILSLSLSYSLLPPSPIFLPPPLSPLSLPLGEVSDDTSIPSSSKSSSVSPRKAPRSTIAESANNKYSFPGNYGTHYYLLSLFIYLLFIYLFVIAFYF